MNNDEFDPDHLEESDDSFDAELDDEMNEEDDFFDGEESEEDEEM